MKYGLYCMRDEIAQTFGTVVQDINDDCARRNFRFGLENSKDVRNFSPEDFSLYKVGEYDDTTGEVIPVVPYILERGVKRAKVSE